VLKECYLPDPGLVFSGEFGGGDVASKNLKIIAITDAGQRHEVKCPCARPSADVYDPRDMSDVDSRRDERRIIKYVFDKVILLVQAVRSIIFSFPSESGGSDGVPKDLLTIVAQKIIAKGVRSGGHVSKQMTVIGV
jgi:hypothetical protein